MIRFVNLSKSFATPNGGRKYLVRNSSVTFPTGSIVGLMGRNGAGKSTLLRIIAGTQDPDSGRIIRQGTVSWPIGFAGSFHGDLTGAQNTRFVARIYGADTEALMAYVEEFSELGDFFHMPFRTYSSGMRSRLAFGVSMGIPFDTYLIDEVTSVGDQNFREKCTQVFHSRLKHAGAIMVSHSLSQIRDICHSGAVLNNGELTYYDDVREAIEVHRENMQANIS